MPKKGFKFITVRESTYKTFESRYEKQKVRLGLVGITSFSGYITFILELSTNEPELYEKLIKKRIKNMLEFVR